MKNMLNDIPAQLPNELFTDLINGKNFRVERIVSQGHSSPENFWYDQEEHEWVLILQGEAELLLEGEDKPRKLKVGDYLSIPAHCRHRVIFTTSSPKTIWLAIFYQ